MHACTDMCVCIQVRFGCKLMEAIEFLQASSVWGWGEKHRGTKPSKAYIPTIVQATMELLNSEAVMAQGRADFFGRMMGLGG